MSTDIKLFTKKIYVTPSVNGMHNVVSKVDWVMLFERNGAVSTALVNTFLDTTNLTADLFTPVTQLTAADVLRWAIQTEGGEAFIDRLKQIHEPMLARAELEKSLVSWEIPLLEPREWDDKYAR